MSSHKRRNPRTHVYPTLVAPHGPWQVHLWATYTHATEDGQESEPQGHYPNYQAAGLAARQWANGVGYALRREEAIAAARLSAKAARIARKAAAPLKPGLAGLWAWLTGLLAQRHPPPELSAAEVEADNRAPLVAAAGSEKKPARPRRRKAPTLETAASGVELDEVTEARRQRTLRMIEEATHGE